MNFLDILSGTPFWVYAVFVYLIIRGVKSLQPNDIPLIRLTIIPFILISWSLYSLHSKYCLSPHIVGIWLLSLFVGILIGWFAFYRNIKVNKKSMIVHLPGSWYPLILYMLFFALKYCIGFTYAVAPEMNQNIFFGGTDAIASGLISGIFGGRLLFVIKQL